MGGMGSLPARPEIAIEAPVRSTDHLSNWLAAKSQEGLRPHVKGSLLVTSGIIPTHIAAQTLVG